VIDEQNAPVLPIGCFLKTKLLGSKRVIFGARLLKTTIAL
jgi:hypothetical protein